MGLGLNIIIHAHGEAEARAIIVAAKHQAKRMKWRPVGPRRSALHAAFHPHRKSEWVVLNFSEALRSECYVKTNYAPARVHVAIVEFLDALRPLCKALRVQDEFGYWKNRNRESLEEGFRIGQSEVQSEDMYPVTFILGAMVGRPGGKMIKRKGTRVTIQAPGHQKKSR